MGADLITYMLVGPKEIKLNPKLQAKALKVAKAAISGFPEDEDGDPFGLRNLSDEQLTETISSFVNFWNCPDSRDTNVRLFSPEKGGKTYKILVAGDSTWGDSPDGLGYETCNKADTLNLFPVFGIE